MSEFGNFLLGWFFVAIVSLGVMGLGWSLYVVVTELPWEALAFVSVTLAITFMVWVVGGFETA
jgi:hypothetical protein